MTELERIARELCLADGRDPNAPVWSLYTDYVRATFDASSLLNAMSLDNDPENWRHTCTVPLKT